MSRDHRKLKVFHMADQLVLESYQCTRMLPEEERFGLQAQIRRAGVSAVTNIVEGCCRASTRDYLHFMRISLGSASEAGYLLGLTGRLGLLRIVQCTPVSSRYDELVRALQALIDRLNGLP